MELQNTEDIMNSNTTGVILAGGKNSRMGFDKGLLPVDGIKIAERIIAVMQPIFQDIIIISNGSKYDYLGYDVYRDIIKSSGPLGGIHSALSHSKTEKNFVVSCDMPFLNPEIIQFIIENAVDCEIAIPSHNGKLEPLCAVYNQSCKTKIEELLKKRALKLKNMLKHFITHQIVIPQDMLTKGNCFANINTPEEYKNIKTSKHEYSN